MEIKFTSSYLKADNVKEGDIITIIDPGKEQESKFTYPNGDPKTDYNFTVRYKDEERNLRMNQTSLKRMVKAFTSDTLKWVDQKAKILVLPTPNGDKEMIVLSPMFDNEEEGEGWAA